MKKAVFAVLILLASCKSTDSINRFAKSAAAGTAEIGKSTLSFTAFCRSYSQGALKPYTDTSLYATSAHPALHCSGYREADSMVNLINLTLVNYFTLLQAVSDKKLLAYDARDLVNSLAGIQHSLQPNLSISDEKVSALKGLLNTVLNEPLKAYRYQKLLQIMRENDSALSRVIQAYGFILDSALNGEISQAKENYRSFVYAPLYEWAREPVEKVWINQQYRLFMDGMDNEQARIHKAGRLLILLQKDHYLLAFGKVPVGFAYTEAEISQDIVLINKMTQEIIQLMK